MMKRIPRSESSHAISYRQKLIRSVPNFLFFNIFSPAAFRLLVLPKNTLLRVTGTNRVKNIYGVGSKTQKKKKISRKIFFGRIRAWISGASRGVDYLNVSHLLCDYSNRIRYDYVEKAGTPRLLISPVFTSPVCKSPHLNTVEPRR